MKTFHSDNLLAKRFVYHTVPSEHAVYYTAEDQSPHPLKREEGKRKIEPAYHVENSEVNREIFAAPEVFSLEEYEKLRAEIDERTTALTTALEELQSYSSDVENHVQEIKDELKRVLGHQAEGGLNDITKNVVFSTDPEEEETSEGPSKDPQKKALQDLLEELKRHQKSLDAAQSYLKYARNNFDQLIQSELKSIADAVERLKKYEGVQPTETPDDGEDDELSNLFVDANFIFSQADDKYHFDPETLGEFGALDDQAIYKEYEEYIRRDRALIRESQKRVHKTLVAHQKFTEREHMPSEDELFEDSGELQAVITEVQAGMKKEQQELQRNKDEIEGNDAEYKGATIPKVESLLKKQRRNGARSSEDLPSTEIDPAELAGTDDLLSELKTLLEDKSVLTRAHEVSQENEDIVRDTSQVYELKNGVFETLKTEINEQADGFLNKTKEVLQNLSETVEPVKNLSRYDELQAACDEAIAIDFDGENFQNDPQMTIDTFLSQINLIKVMNDVLNLMDRTLRNLKSAKNTSDMQKAVKDMIKSFQEERDAANHFVMEMQTWFESQIVAQRYINNLGPLDEEEEKETIKNIQSIREEFVLNVASTLMGVFVSEEKVGAMKAHLQSGGAVTVKFHTDAQSEVFHISGDRKNADDLIVDYTMKDEKAEAEALGHEVKNHDGDTGLIDEVLRFVNAYLDDKSAYQEGGHQVFVDLIKRANGGEDTGSEETPSEHIDVSALRAGISTDADSESEPEIAPREDDELESGEPGDDDEEEDKDDSEDKDA